MLGIDVVDVERFKKLIKKESFMAKVFTKRELEYIYKAPVKEETAAGIFACKEATAKALGKGIGYISFMDIEVGHDSFSKPFLILNEKIINRLSELGFKDIAVSISHEKAYALANALLTREDNIFSKKIAKDLPLLKTRDKFSNKSTFGRVAIVGGSKGMLGSVIMASRAALRTGSGLVHSLVPKSQEGLCQLMSLENIVEGLEDEGSGFFSKSSIDDLKKRVDSFDAMAFGVGVSKNYKVYALLEYLIGLDKNMVLDADGLNLISKEAKLLKNAKKLIITPHEMEFARLTGKSLEYIRQNRKSVASFFSIHYNVIVVLKGHNTLVVCGDDIYENKAESSALATAGTGDVLTGMIVSLLGQGYEPFEAAKLAVYLHSRAGDLAASDLGEDSVIASDVIERINLAIREKRKFDETSINPSNLGRD